MARARTTGIEWTEHTWNPFVGCSIHTAGCTNCYAMGQAMRIVRMGTTASYDGTVKLAGNGKPIWTGRVNKASAAAMRRPLTIREPSIIFVNSMSDFFHEAAQDAWRLEALEIMVRTPHQYQVLTKRPENILPFLERTKVAFPRNVWIGATLERGDFAHRIDTLREVPATIRFLSVEPLIGYIGEVDLSGIHWVITGGESGPGSRPMHSAWVREVRDLCVAQSVPHFFKQWGDWRPVDAHAGPLPERPIGEIRHLDLEGGVHKEPGDNREPIIHVGKKVAGAEIDGQRWREYPMFEPQRPLF